MGRSCRIQGTHSNVSVGWCNSALHWVWISTAGAIILSATYGYVVDPRPYQDPFIKLADKVTSEGSEAIKPGGWLVDIIPARKVDQRWWCEYASIGINVICSSAASGMAPWYWISPPCSGVESKLGWTCCDTIFSRQESHGKPTMILMPITLLFVG